MELLKFKARYPLINASDLQIQAILDEAHLFVMESVWGNWREIALGLYAAHILTIETSPNAQTGYSLQLPIHKKVGEVEIQYLNAGQESEKAWYDFTIWGQRYWALLQARLKQRGFDQ